MLHYVPPNRRGGGYTAFGADPVGVAHCLHSTSWTNGWILTKLAQTHYWEGGKKWLDFGDLDLIFKVTPALWNFQKKKACVHHTIKTVKWALSAPYFLNQMTDSGQTSYIVILGWFKDLVRFWWSSPNFQGHHTIKLKNEPCLHLSPEPIGGVWPNLHRNTIRRDMGKKLLDFGDLDLIFKVTPALWISNFDLQKKHLLNQMMDSGQTLCIVSLG